MGNMTIQRLDRQIAVLIKARRKAHGNDVEQSRINGLLDRLYDAKGALCRANGRIEE